MKSFRTRTSFLSIEDTTSTLSSFSSLLSFPDYLTLVVTFLERMKTRNPSIRALSQKPSIAASRILIECSWMACMSSCFFRSWVDQALLAVCLALLVVYLASLAVCLASLAVSGITHCLSGLVLLILLKSIAIPIEICRLDPHGKVRSYLVLCLIDRYVSQAFSCHGPIASCIVSFIDHFIS